MSFRPREFVAFLAGGAVMFVLIKGIPTVVGDWRTVQTIKTSDGAHEANLKRLYGYMDVNFEVELDNKKIYRSPDFAPNPENSFRERITWSRDETLLLLLVADEILFGYDIPAETAFPPERFDQISVPPQPLHALGYEGVGLEREKPKGE